MANFITAQKIVAGHEGGYSASKIDVGNWLAVNGQKTAYVTNKDGQMVSPIGGKVVFVGTKYGVSAPVLAAWLNSPVTAEDMKQLSYDTALRIYKKNYWDLQIQGDKINDQQVAEIMYDAVIQHGAKANLKMLTAATGKPVGIPLDDSEVAIINQQNPKELYDKIKNWRINYYHELAARPGQAGNLKGWMNRINSFAYTAFEKAKEAVKEAASTVAEKVSENKGASAAAGLFFLVGAGLYANHKLKKKK